MSIAHWLKLLDRLIIPVCTGKALRMLPDKAPTFDASVGWKGLVLVDEPRIAYLADGFETADVLTQSGRIAAMPARILGQCD